MKMRPGRPVPATVSQETEERKMDLQSNDLVYVGFWARVWAMIVDVLLYSITVVFPVTLALIPVYGWESFPVRLQDFPEPLHLLTVGVVPAIAILIFWTKKRATPGKIVVCARIADAKTGENPTIVQMIVRYVAYYLSALPIGLGFLWIAFDKRKQGWHDKLAGTVVVRRREDGAGL
jgi:uncharacterized RDD family membrane protein YckC